MILLKKSIVFLLLVGALMLSSCTMSAEELKANVIEANTNLGSYSADMDMVMDMSVETLKGVQEMSSSMTSQANIDRSEKKLYLKNVMSTKVEGMNMDFESESYFLDEIVYIKSMGMWIKQNLDESLWNEQDQVSQTTELIENGDVEMLDSEDGFYVLKITPDVEMLGTLLNEQQQSAFIESIVDYSDVVESYTATVWIDKKTFIIMKSSVDMVLVMTPENSELEAEQDFVEMRINSTINMELSNIGDEFDFELPNEAKDAIDMTGVLGTMGSASKIA